LERRIDRVTIAGSRDATTVAIPWDSSQALLLRLRKDEHATTAVVDAFVVVGTSRPVVLDKVGKRILLGACTDWLDEAGVDALPPGIFELRNALEDEKPGASSTDALLGPVRLRLSRR
jgi:hypothetical protein